jgi:hypothetical protein
MNKVELARVIDEASFCVEIQMEEPVNIRQMTRDVARLVKFLDDFCSYPTLSELAEGRVIEGHVLKRAYRQKFNRGESDALREIIGARIEKDVQKLKAYTKLHSRG